MPVAEPSHRSNRFTYFAVLGLTLAAFAGVVAFVTWQLRMGLREQVLQHEGEFLASVATMQLDNEAKRLEASGLSDAPGALLAAVMETSKLPEVFALRVFDAQRQFRGALPWPWSEDPPDAEEWAQLTAGHAQVRLHPREALAEFLGAEFQAKPGEAAVPAIETWVPLHRSGGGAFEGSAQFWRDGKALAQDFDNIDRQLILQAVLAWLAGALVSTVALTWAFRRLDASNRALIARGDDLRRANRELVLAAKTSALGTVTAHLIHQLKNPLAGLETYVASRSDPAVGGESGGELAAASELTRRLRAMINDVVDVLRDEEHGAHFELSCAEIAELALVKVRPSAARGAVSLKVDAMGETDLPGRRANLAGLVLQNLLQNAIEATQRGGEVRLGSAIVAGGGVEFTVSDQGPGLPVDVRHQLFQPCTSSKPGGSGLGLALSHQLTQQAGGTLAVAKSDPTGTVFRLWLPMEH